MVNDDSVSRDLPSLPFFYPFAKMFEVMVFLGFRWVPGVSVGSNLQEAIISSPPKPSFATVVSWGPVDPKYQYG